MKANEAPEKLYVNFHFIETHPESHQPLVTKQGINKYDIEYTRTDAFIEKAVEFFDEYLWKYIDIKNANCDAFVNINSNKFEEDFINYMKGE